MSDPISRGATATIARDDRPELPSPPGQQPTGRSRKRHFWVVGLAVVSIASLAAAGVGTGDLVKPGGELIGDFFGAALQPKVDGDFLVLTLAAATTTAAYAVLGTALSLVIGLVGGVLTSELWWKARSRRPRASGAAWGVARMILVVPRAIHEIVWGLVFLIVFGIDPIVAVLAIGIPFGAVTAKVFADILDETPRHPYHALVAAGASRSSAVLYALLPQALPDLLSYAFYRFECAIRSAAVLGLVGAGGLGFELALSFQSLRYDEIWTLLYALILLSAGADLWSSRVRSRRVQLTGTARGRGRAWPSASLIAAVVLVPVSAWWVGLDLGTLVTQQPWRHVGDMAADAWPISAGEGGLAELIRLSGATVAMSIIAMLVAFWGGAILAFPASNLPRWGRRSSGTPLSRGSRLIVLLLCRLLLIVQRAIPSPIWAMLFLFVFYPGILPGALALGVYTMGVLGRLMAESAENLEGRPLKALRSHGASELHVFCYGVVPAAAPRFVAFGLYRWEVTIRETVVVGVVGAGGLGLLLDQQLSVMDYGAVVITLVTIILLTMVVDFISAAARRSIR